MDITFDRGTLANLEKALSLEWLETNGLGGWAGSTVIGAHTRGYHGLFVAATKPPVERQVLLSRLDETIVLQGERTELASRVYPDAVYPEGHHYLERFALTPFPVFDYRVGSLVLRKTIAAIHGENTVVVLYEVVAADEPFVLELQPFIAGRDYHFRSRMNADIQKTPRQERGLWAFKPYAHTPEFFMAIPGATFEARPDWYYHFEYRQEKERGLDDQEDLFTPGTFKINLKAGARFGVVISLQKSQSVTSAAELFQREQKRRQLLTSHEAFSDDFIKPLILAADQFIVDRERNLKTLIAGYPWFTDWGRDTMIALPGVCLVTGHFDDAKKILKAFARYQSQGFLPNRFPDASRDPEYNSVDAALWFAVAAYKTFHYTKDLDLVRQTLLPVLRETIQWYRKGTWFFTRVCDDGLLACGNENTNLTWMDARVGDHPVTPRFGKPVELNALWYNLLLVAASFCDLLKLENEKVLYRDMAQACKVSFEKHFWNAEKKCLYDVVMSDEHKDASVRPNQILALSLPFALLGGEHARAVLTTVEERLLTPVGLRSLDPADSRYHGRYEGDGAARDSAYHQGTVWGWLLGPYITAMFRFLSPDEAHRKAAPLLAAVRDHLQAAGLGSVSEIFDGDFPHTPRGCIAQAWSVGEILRAYVEDVSGRTVHRSNSEGPAAVGSGRLAARGLSEQL